MMDDLSNSRVNDVVFRPGSTELASAGFDGTVRIWDLPGSTTRVLHTFATGAISVAYSPDGARLAAADSAGTILVWDAESGDLVIAPDEVSGETHLTFAPDGRRLAGAGPGPVAYLWDLDTGRIVRRFLGAYYTPGSLAFVNAGTELRVAGGVGIDRGYLLDPKALVDLARDETSRALTEAECERYLRRPCDG
jgi:hypothetical protein